MVSDIFASADPNYNPDRSITAADVVELAHVTRNGAVESRHLGVLAVVGPDGELVASLGDPEALIFPRSTLKPFQAFASLRAGAELDDEELALACASHQGGVRHQELAERMLREAGLDAGALKCPDAMPRDAQARRDRIKQDAGPDKLAFNCSGKHAGFLKAAIASGVDTESYLDPEHPVQKDALHLLEVLGGAPLGVVGVDGCGAPAPQLTVTALARAVARLVSGSLPEGHCFTDDDATMWARIAPAMLAHPWAVHGEGEENTVTMQRTGVVAKLGAEAVLVLGTKDGYGVALKMLDGGDRANTRVGLDALVALGLADSDAVAAALAEMDKPVLGGGVPVGEVRSSASVTRLRRK